MSELGSFYFEKIEGGERKWLNSLALEEFNLLHARNLALVNGWKERIMGTMQGISKLFNLTGRISEWER